MDNQLTPFQAVIRNVEAQESLFMPVVSDESIVWEKEKQFAIQVLSKPDSKNKREICYVGKIALSNPASLQNAIVNVAAVGITLNPAAKLAYLVPRDGAICLDISYMGLLHIAQQAGAILWGQCKLVHDNDQYTSVGLDKPPKHEYNPFGDRGAVVGGYCTVKTPSGDYLTEEMSLGDIVKAQQTSKAKSGPWLQFWEEMARKTIVKRGSKYWPKVDRLDTAINHLNTDGGEGLESSSDKPQEKVIENPKRRLKELLANQDESKYLPWLGVESIDDLTDAAAAGRVKQLENAKQ